jgi:NDP-sugar pyrophosphorylase family protein
VHDISFGARTFGGDRRQVKLRRRALSRLRARLVYGFRRMTTAVVLAAGRGSRMGPLTAARPKPLLEVAGRPLIAYVLGGLAAAGVEHVVLVTGYLGEQVEAVLGDGAALGVRLSYRRQDQPTGTAHALLLAASLIESAPFIVGWADILLARAFYGEFVAAYAARPCAVQLAVNPVDDPWRGGAVYVEPDGRIRRLVEKPPRGRSTTTWNNAGLMYLAPAVLDYARRLTPSLRGEYELPQAVAQMIDDGHSAYAVPVRGAWLDVGTPADLAAAAALLDAAQGGA